MKRFVTNSDVFKTNDSELRITFLNGAAIEFKTAEKPDNLYGEDVHAVVLDEYTRMRFDSWHAIRSTLTATRGRAKFIGNVNGVGWGYELARKVETGEAGDDWAYFKVTAADSIDAGILDKSEIDDAERTLPRAVFLELYYCIPNIQSSDRFAYSFNKEKHVGHCRVNMNHPVYLSFDFNYNPISCSVIQNYNGCIFVLECVKLPNSNIYNLCNTIKSKYPDMMYIVTGDATGKNNSALVKDNLNYYKVIKKELRVSDGRMRVPSVNPPMAENQVLVNAIFEHVPVLIDIDKAAPLIYDCEFVRVDNENKIVKTDRNDPTQQADAMDTFRYYLNTFRKNFGM